MEKTEDRIVLSVLERLEWSGTRLGPGSGPHFSGGDGRRHPACPLCGGLKEASEDFRDGIAGHRNGCSIAHLLGRETVDPEGFSWEDGMEEVHEDDF